MIEAKYMDGYEGEGEVLIYYEHNRQKVGILIWEGYFEFLLSACFNNDFKLGGLIESYNNHSGYYDESPWKINNLKLVIYELENFNLDKIETDSKDIRETVVKLKNEIMSYLKTANLNNKMVYIQYN